MACPTCGPVLGYRARLSSSPPLYVTLSWWWPQFSHPLTHSSAPHSVQANCTFIGCGRDQNKHLMAHYNLAKKVRPPLATCAPACLSRTAHSSINRHHRFFSLTPAAATFTHVQRNMGEEHCVCINLRTKMVWCYACDEEVIGTCAHLLPRSILGDCRGHS
jgi:hypothetical protein